jgi:hypothetical protein
VISEKEQAAFDLVEENEEKLLERYRTVIGVDTSVPPGNTYEELIHYLAF